MNHPCKNLDLCFGRGWEHARQDTDVTFTFADHPHKGYGFYMNKFQLSDPTTGKTKTFEPDITLFRYAHMLGRRLGDYVAGSDISTLLEGFIFRISGANDLNGRSLVHGINSYGFVHLMRKPGQFGYQAWRAKRKGSLKRRPLKGMIIDKTVRSISLVVVKRGVNVISGLTDTVAPKTLGPKRASKIRKLFNLSKLDDVKKYVIKRKVIICKKFDEKGVKIQRLITPERLRRKKQKLQRSLERSLKRKRERKEWKKKFKVK